MSVVTDLLQPKDIDNWEIEKKMMKKKKKKMTKRSFMIEIQRFTTAQK